MPHETENPDTACDTPGTGPPRIYIRACGALCDAFWWARPTPQAEPGDCSDRERDD
jgi:hypothetical protein